MRYFCWSLAKETDREEIRRKLASGSDEDSDTTCEKPFRKYSLPARTRTDGMNLQLCYLNQVPGDEIEMTSLSHNTSSSEFVSESEHKCRWAESLTPMSSSTSSVASISSVSSLSSAPSLFSSSSSSLSPNRSSNNNNGSGNENVQQPLSSSKSSSSKLHRRSSDLEAPSPDSAFSLPTSGETLAERQQRLQQEAKLALAQASITARMQLEIERRNRKRSPIADMVGLPEFGEGRRLKIPRKLLQEMNFAQLQVLVNDLHTQIESLNEELVELLIERDDLHMGQDSMLVDIEDLTSFAQHMSETNNNKTTLNNRNSSLKKTTNASVSRSSSATKKRFQWARNPSGSTKSAFPPSSPQDRQTDSVNGNK